jgi:hypothetical protein
VNGILTGKSIFFGIALSYFFAGWLHQTSSLNINLKLVETQAEEIHA